MNISDKELLAFINEDEELLALIKKSVSSQRFPIPITREIINRYRISRKSSFHLGVTGTRHPLPDPQYFAFTDAIMTFVAIWISTPSGQSGMFHIHHGCCTGADTASHFIARHIEGTLIHGHPGVDYRGESPYRMTDTDPAKPYLERNTDIVAYADALIAAPQYEEGHPQSARSGTWQTIRLARKVKLPILIVWPNGRTEADKPLRRIYHAAGRKPKRT